MKFIHKLINSNVHPKLHNVLNHYDRSFGDNHVSKKIQIESSIVPNFVEIRFLEFVYIV